MLRFRPLFASLLTLAVLVFARRAGAQSISVNNKTSLVRLAADGSIVTKRQINPEAVNYADCLANQSIQISYVASGADGLKTLEVWAGQQDCKPVAARSGTTQQCWRPASNLPAAQTGTITIPIRNILKRRTGTDVVDATNDPSVCDNIPLSTFSLYFMWFQGTGTEPIGTSDQVDIPVKTQGPSALSGLTVAPGNTRLIVTFSSTGEAGVTDQQGVRVYCDPSPTSKAPTTKTTTTCPDASASTDDAGDAEAVDSGDSGCTTTTETTSGGGACTSSSLTPVTADGGAPGLPDAKFLCAELGGNTGSRVVVERINGVALENNKTYAVAVASVDSYGNVGGLGEATCATPGETTDFWQLYRDSGGQAGGCSSESAPIGGLVSMIPVLGAIAAVIRRRVRRTEK